MMSELAADWEIFFIAGTDTGVGKTFVTAALLRALNERGLAAVGYKPVCCGQRDDAIDLFEASAEPPCADANLDVDTVNPCWLKSPLAPLVAARIEDRTIDLGKLVNGARRMRSEYGYRRVLVEGAGGWATPLAPGRVTMADFAVALAAPVLLVVDNKLGALNHTLLTVAAIERCGLRCAGIILNHCRDERDSASISNPAVLAEMLPGVPIVAELLYGEPCIDLDSDSARWSVTGLV